MNCSILQFDTAWMDPDANLALIGQHCQKLSGQSDLLILPEMFNTGYTMTPEQIPHEWQDITISKLQNLSAKFNITICGTIPMFKEGYWYNTFIFVNASGLIHQYHKVHLFTLAGEKDVYASGQESLIFKMKHWDILPLICYDLRFPYLSFTEKQPDLIIFSANWPETRVQHWRSLLIARAIENQCFVIGVNRTGKDKNGYIYPGSSMIIDFNGDILIELGKTSAIENLYLNKEQMQAFRTKLPFFKDRKFND